MNRRRLYRCSHDRRLAGVAGGLAEYFDIDPTLVRVLWIASIFFGGAGLVLYILMAIVVPLEPEPFVTAPSDPAGLDRQGATATDAGAGGTPPSDWHAAPAGHRHEHGRSGGSAATFFGIILILFGALALADQLLPAWADHGRFLWPAFILGVGALLVATSLRRDTTSL